MPAAALGVAAMPAIASPFQYLDGSQEQACGHAIRRRDRLAHLHRPTKAIEAAA
jgi:hypothetical protein